MPNMDYIIEELKQICGPDKVSTNPIDIQVMTHSLAYNLIPYKPDVIIVPQSDPMGGNPIPRVLSLANRYRIPVTVKGGIGMGGSSPREGGILIDMCRMDKILEINPDLQYIIAEGGASIYNMQKVLRDYDLHIPNYGTYESSTIIAGTFINAGIGYGMTTYGWLADLVIGIEVVFPDGEVMKFGSLANEYTEFGPFARHVNGPDPISMFIQSAGSLGVITRVAVRVIRLKREELHEYCFSWKRDQIEEFQKVMLALCHDGIYDLHFNDRWTFHWMIEEDWLKDVPEDSWFFLLPMIHARTEKEWKAKEERMCEICLGLGGRELIEVAEIHRGGPGKQRGRFASFNVCGPYSWVGAAARNAGMFAVTSKFYPLTFFKLMYEFDEKVKKNLGLWIPEYFPQHDSYVVNDCTIKEQFFVCYNPYHEEDVRKLGMWMGTISKELTRKGACWAPPSPSLPRYSFEKLGPAYEFIKRFKKMVDPNNILNPGGLM